MSVLVTTACGTEREFETVAKAEDGIDTHEALCEDCTKGDCELEKKGITDEVDAEVIKHSNNETVQKTDGGTTTKVVESDDNPQLPDEQPGVSTDPLEWVPSDFIDHIDDTPAINRKGYDVLAHHYNISVTTEVLVSPPKTDYKYAEVVATAITDDGINYTAHGSAHTERGDDSYLLLEMADTRAAKRATARATGVGLVAVQELKNEL